jgi:hypothetical protein
MTKALRFVHCHVCPLKEVCDYGDDEASYIYHNRIMKGLFVLDEKPIWEAVKNATLNCPLKKVITSD